MLNGINEAGLRRYHFVQARSEPGATSEDMIDYVLPRARARPGLLVLHVGMLTKRSNINPNIPVKDRPQINTVDCLKQVIAVIRKEAPKTKIAFSSKYLQEVLSVLDDKTEVAVETSTPSSPGVLKPVSDEDYVHVIMPMFVQW